MYENEMRLFDPKSGQRLYVDSRDSDLFLSTAKGFRHGFGVAMVLGGMDIYSLQHIMGHERPETTSIYLQVKGQEAHELQMQYWKRANKNWVN